MNQILKKVPVDHVVEGENVRIHYELEGLVMDIAQNGLKTPIMVWTPPGAAKSSFEVLEGHRRLRAIKTLANDQPDAFQVHFSNGVSAIICGNLTEQEAWELKVDHGNELALRDPYELLQCARMLFNAGHTEEQVANDLVSLIERITPMAPKVKRTIETLKLAKTAAEKAGEQETADNVEADIRQTIFDYRRGLVQYLHNTARCPDLVMSALYFKATGKHPEGMDSNIPLPTLTHAKVLALWNAHKKDLDVKDKGVPKFGRTRPGPEFTKKWAEYVKAEKDVKTKKDSGIKRVKAMPASDITKELEEGKFNSQGFRLMCLHHTGKESSGRTSSRRLGKSRTKSRRRMRLRPMPLLRRPSMKWKSLRRSRFRSTKCAGHNMGH